MILWEFKSPSPHQILWRKLFISSHLILRLELREIPYSLPKKVYQISQERYFDTKTFKKIAVKEVRYKNKLREMAVIYEEVNNQINLITIHPLKNYQKISRIKSGKAAKIMKNSKKIINYDPKSDALYLGIKKGIEEEFVEVSSGVNVELNSEGQVIGIEILNASKVLKPVVKPLQKQLLEPVVK